MTDRGGGIDGRRDGLAGAAADFPLTLALSLRERGFSSLALSLGERGFFCRGAGDGGFH